MSNPEDFHWNVVMVNGMPTVQNTMTGEVIHGWSVGDRLYFEGEDRWHQRLLQLFVCPRITYVTEITKNGFRFERRKPTVREWLKDFAGLFLIVKDS